MATYDWTGTDIIPNGSGSAVRADLNDALLALFSQNSSATAPPETVAYMTWADTSTGLYKIRNAANSGWITLYQLDGEWTTIALENGTAAAPSLYFKDSGTDTGLYSPGADQVAIATAGVQRVNFNGATEVVYNDGGADVDFRIEGDTEPNLFKIDAGTDQVQVKNLNGGPLAGTRNRIINGDMRIDQRNAGAAVTLISAGVYTVDRWLGWEDTDGSATATQSTTAPTGYTNSLLYTVTSADTSLSAAQYTVLGQRVEGFNAADFAFGTASAATITIGFWVRSSITGTFAGGISNSAGNRSYVFTYTISAANTWEYKSAAIPGDTSGTWLTDNGIGLNLYFSLGAGSNFQATAGSWGSANSFATSSSVNLIGTNGATFYITGVQLEAGSVATPFERRSYGQELALCQRYYQKAAAILNASPVTGAAYLPVVMRATPSVTTISIDTGTGGAWAALSNSTLYQSSFNSNSSGSAYAASAEL